MHVVSLTDECFKLLLFSAPDLPPSGITATTLGKTGITIRWRPVPLGYRGGIITGYRITYNSSNSTSRWRNVSGDASYVTLTSLAKFTFYDVYIQAHTIKGSGPANYLKTATDMGGEVDDVLTIATSFPGLFPPTFKGKAQGPRW